MAITTNTIIVPELTESEKRSNDEAAQLEYEETGFLLSPPSIPFVTLVLDDKDEITVLDVKGPTAVDVYLAAGLRVSSSNQNGVITYARSRHEKDIIEFNSISLEAGVHTFTVGAF
jgi:hypothetical protein